MPSCLGGYFVCPKFFSWVFRGFKFFLVGISWVQKFFSWVFRGSDFFFLVSISWVQFFFVVVDFVIQRFSVAGCISKSDKDRNTKYISNHAFFLEKCIRKVLHLLNYLRYSTAFICSNCIFRYLFFSVLGPFHS